MYRNEVTVEELKEILQKSLDTLDEYDDKAQVEVVGNTYFCNHARYVLSIAGVGFINLGNDMIVIAGDEGEEED